MGFRAPAGQETGSSNARMRKLYIQFSSERQRHIHSYVFFCFFFTDSGVFSVRNLNDLDGWKMQKCTEAGKSERLRGRDIVLILEMFVGFCGAMISEGNGLELC